MMNERIKDMARQAGATDENGNRAEHIFCFTESELDAFVQKLAADFIGSVKSMKSKHQIKTNYGIRKG